MYMSICSFPTEQPYRFKAGLTCLYSHLTYSEKIFAAQKIEEVIGQKIEKQTAKIEKQSEFESPKTA